MLRATTSHILQALLSMLNVKVHDCAIRKRLNESDLFKRVAMTKHLLSKKGHDSMT